ncbi:TIGR04282 family arsenosugar biosynthesis glycosyltransferase [Chloroflexota bacterium]
MSMGTTALVIFIRFPHSGKVKSRLAQTLGPGIATVFYQLCAQKIVCELDQFSGEVNKYLSYSQKSDKDEIGHWAGSRFRLIPQDEGDLGQRLEQSFRSLLKGGFGKAIIMASDVPDLTKNIMNDAVSALDDHDLVIGPCNDGGYYLIGMKKLHGELFEGISWSTDKVLEQTLTIASEQELSVFSLITLRDIDTEHDLKEWVRSSEGTTNPILEYARAVLPG